MDPSQLGWLEIFETKFNPNGLAGNFRKIIQSKWIGWKFSKHNPIQMGWIKISHNVFNPNLDGNCPKIQNPLLDWESTNISVFGHGMGVGAAQESNLMFCPSFWVSAHGQLLPEKMNTPCPHPIWAPRQIKGHIYESQKVLIFSN